VEVWHNTPFMMLVLLAGIQSIPQELYDAAKADGATPWQSFWSITLPLLTFTMAVGVMIRLIDLTKLFGLIFVLTYGGPGSSTETVAFTTYLAGFKDFRMSYAAALSYVIVGGVLVLSSLSMFAALVVSLPTAYAIARWKFGGGLLSILLLVLRMLPSIALIIPIYIMYKMLGLTNSYLGLVLVYTVVYVPFAVWLL